MHIVLGLYNRWHENAVRFHSSHNCSEIKAGHRSNSSPLERLRVGAATEEHGKQIHGAKPLGPGTLLGPPID